MDLFYEIYQKGEFYNPAVSHYNFEVIEVGCDRCGKLPIKTCIGWYDHDLCLNCVADLEDIFEGDYSRSNSCSNSRSKSCSCSHSYSDSD